MNLCDCTVLKVINTQTLKKENFKFLNHDYVIYKVLAISEGIKFLTTIHVKAEDDKRQVKKGYKFQR